MYVLDVTSEEILGNSTHAIPAHEAGATFAGDFTIESEGEPTRRILIGATLSLDDLSADNNDVWFIPWRDVVASAERKKKKTTKKAGPRPCPGPRQAQVLGRRQ